MVQTPQQRKANEKYAKYEEAKRGKLERVAKSKVTPKAPVSVAWVGTLNHMVSCSTRSSLRVACV
ncbi:hypothetical protein LOZ53_006746 [Ophidiomyces ophidiicola]|uniref:Uncharacterized protein n=1 Tax=Ophidiomyces ophidiicola TaxID=1387563 RepID=A0ACB8UM55_9EURO|nr:hypothetical protein LOZ60_006770 [Ophidiomyces ophidiicola]KAI1931344.1 hypothetical protein LOZ62_006812 [Ophidiomyces ophidiicola]KAI1977389.1 hypothetical protein LOZ54_006490 [Ophidiomyces ophidiicola]KAI1979631.1 hypothetical protein LOZ53_006746 [Ophidiomyces ophidiicola]KAI1983426.1 hypothetical protein LOZ51_006884 [Ophidiomyces ophidiicola]